MNRGGIVNENFIEWWVSEARSRWLLITDGMRRPVSGGMLYAPKLSTCFEAQEIKETGNEEG
jgi:hypothetical protein